MSSRSKEEMLVVACLFFILFVGVADQQILSPLLPAIQNDFAKSSTEMGFLFTGYSFCAGLSVLLWGPLSDVFGRKKGLLHGLIVFSCGAFISFLSISYPMLLAGRIIAGMGASMLSLNCLSYAADFFPYANRGRAMGSIFSSYFAALILGVPLGAWLGDKLGWNSVFGVVGGIALLLFIATKFRLPQLKDKIVQTRLMPPSDCIRQYIGFLKVPSSLGALFSSFFASAGPTGFLAFLGVWLHDSFGISAGRTNSGQDRQTASICSKLPMSGTVPIDASGFEMGHRPFHNLRRYQPGSGFSTRSHGSTSYRNCIGRIPGFVCRSQKFFFSNGHRAGRAALRNPVRALRIFRCLLPVRPGKSAGSFQYAFYSQGSSFVIQSNAL
jgi:MFS family permease